MLETGLAVVAKSSPEILFSALGKTTQTSVGKRPELWRGLVLQSRQGPSQNLEMPSNQKRGAERDLQKKYVRDSKACTLTWSCPDTAMTRTSPKLAAVLVKRGVSYIQNRRYVFARLDWV